MTGDKAFGDSREDVVAQHRSGLDRSVLKLTGGATGREQFGAVLNAMLFAQEGLQAQWRRGLAINAHERLALMNLWKHGSMTMSELGERIPLSRAAITTLTDRLERMGYLRRTSDDNDRRRTLLVLTDRPSRVLGPLWAQYHDELDRFVDSMTDEQWEWSLQLMRHVADVSETHADRVRALDDAELAQIVDVADRSVRKRA